MPAKPAIHSVAFFLLLGLCCKKWWNEDSCTRRANDLEANYTFLKVCSWSWRFELMQPCLSCTYYNLYNFRGADFVYVYVDFRCDSPSWSCWKALILGVRRQTCMKAHRMLNHMLLESDTGVRCSCRMELCTLPAVSNPSLFNCEAEKAYLCWDYSIFIYINICYFEFYNTYIHTRTLIVDYHMHTLDQKHSGLKHEAGSKVSECS